MKKILILSLIALCLSFCPFFISNVASADIEGVNITVKYTDTSTHSQSTLEGDTYTRDYSTIYQNQNYLISFVANVTGDNGDLSYVWRDSNNVELSNNKTLTLYRWQQLNPDSPNVILVGRSTYTLTATKTVNGQTSTEQKKITVNITDDTNVLTTAKIGTKKVAPTTVNAETESFDFYNFLPIANTYTTSWLLKAPNSNQYEVASEEKSFTFNPAKIINAQNGYGDYILMTKSVDSRKNTFYSNEFRIQATPLQFLARDSYEIQSSIIANSKANVEAFEFTINNQDTLNPENLYWYINNVKICSGFKLIHEPTNTEAFRVTVKYRNEGSLTELTTITTKPEATGMGVLIGVIVGSVALLSAILAFSIIKQNKKRDVIW